jgi:hypothetical protein
MVGSITLDMDSKLVMVATRVIGIITVDPSLVEGEDEDVVAAVAEEDEDMVIQVSTIDTSLSMPTMVPTVEWTSIAIRARISIALKMMTPSLSKTAIVIAMVDPRSIAL